MMPMEPANEVSRVRAFLVRRLLKLSDSEVSNDMDDRPMLLCTGGCSLAAVTSNGSESSAMRPSFNLTMRVAYASASSGLWVTITTNRSRATSLSSSITCTLVSLSSAPVGSSASKMSGSLTSARAIATRCICPPDICPGFLCICCPSPTCSNARLARCRRSALDTPEMVNASSTLASTV